MASYQEVRLFAYDEVGKLIVERELLFSLINEQEYEKFAFHAQKYCLDNDINPKFPEDMETLIESGGSDDIKRDIAYEALTVLINAKNMSNTK